tara:strand:+ start:589 stop:2142 length:1554 start_codon:yes stop_codon:yes gene_type:complete
MDFIRNPFLPQLYNTLSCDLTIQGSVQSKKSEFIIIEHLAMAACGLSVFFVLPKVELRTAYVQNRVNKRIGETPEYRKLIKDGYFDNSVMKNFGKGVIKYVGSNVISDFKEFPGDAIFIEEVDQCSATNIQYGTDRLKGSIYQFERKVGNPKNKGEGINFFYDKTCQNQWSVPCPSAGCGELVKLDFFDVVMEVKFDEEGNPVDYDLRDQDWSLSSGRDIYCICPHCGGPLDREAVGVWIPIKPDRPKEGYQFNMLNSWENTVASMYDSWADAWTNANGMQHFWNSYLGIPFSLGSSRITLDTLKRAARVREPYNFVIKKGEAHIEDNCSTKKCSMGIDVGRNFDVRVSEVESNGSRRAVFIGKVTSRQELIDIGLRYNVYVAVIDSGPETRFVEEFQQDAPFFVWTCRYDGEGTDKRTKKDRKTRSIHIDRTVALDRGMTEFKRSRNFLPMNLEHILEGDYVDEMINSIRKEELDARGNTKMVWTKCVDHQRHADLYDLLASEFCSSSGLDGISVG